ncbi:MAG: ATP-binding protein, partial [Candidatus Rokubacteria bacterium]|nr:ATP-binding protein [Candidatus Rokubacteria bacterium]
MSADERAATAAELDPQQWAIQRRIQDVFAKLGEKFGDLTGRVEVAIRPETSFDQIGGLKEAKTAVRGLVAALTDPELYRTWGITPPKGVLLYGPPGTGKSMLARALATEGGAIFYHLKLMNLTLKFGPNTGELLQEIVGIAKSEGKAVIYLDEANALSLEHLLPPAQAREAGGRIVAALCEKLDGLEDFSRVIVVASTSRTDLVEPPLVAPGRLDRLIEVTLPDGPEQQEILELARARAEKAAGRTLFAEIDYRSVLPPMGGMSGAEISDIVRRALEEKVYAERE